MESFFLGHSERKLYGVFHSASPECYRNRSVLLLYPIGQEYMRIHRAFRRLSDLLSELGFDVLRFDYACTGDSFGDFEDVSFDVLNESATIAYDELLAMSPEAKIDVVALRLGTVVARQLAKDRNVQRLVLWEPNYSDADYLHHWLYALRTRGTTRANFIDEDFLHFNGFAYGTKVRGSLETGSWGSFPANRVTEALIMSTRDTPAHEDFRNAFGSEAKVDIACVAGPDDWTVVDSVGGLFLPEASIATIKKWLSE